ncbi:hypothetical protein [Peribacillus asahii]|uniref:hypothetical protein n=1 Tax=Peribacillus asahii TaxID=228899 RepID=UPI0020798B7B|nr:hypothetical protein [Peribacillus asahii]USK62459.1 hypothetical protein LIT37_23555 [Peribacillus asahii]
MMISIMVSNVDSKIFWLFSLLLSIAVGTTTYIGVTINLGSIKFHTLFLGAALAGFLSFVFMQMADFGH